VTCYTENWEKKEGTLFPSSPPPPPGRGTAYNTQGITINDIGSYAYAYSVLLLKFYFVCMFRREFTY
jgi:hypothetical protein